MIGVAGNDPPSAEQYEQESWGPQGAAKLVTGYTDWHEPWLPVSSDSHNGGHDASH